MLAGEQGPVAAVGDQASDRGRRVLRCRGLRAGHPGAHHGRYREPGRGRASRWLEELAAHAGAQRGVRVPTITDPRGLDLRDLQAAEADRGDARARARAIDAFEALGVLMTNTCINYQTVMPAVRGEHVAMGDTGVVIYANSVLGARTNFEGGPSALAAGLTGRTPRYGYHLPRIAAHAALRSRRTAARPRRLGRAGRHRRPRSRALLGGAGDRRRRRGADLRRAEAFRRGDGELRLGGAVPHVGHHARGGDGWRTCFAGDGSAARRPRSAPTTSRRFYAGYAQAGDEGRRRRVRRAAALLIEMQRARRRCSTAAGARRHALLVDDLPAGQACRRPHGPHRADRGGRRHRAVRHVLLPELRARDGARPTAGSGC